MQKGCLTPKVHNIFQHENTHLELFISGWNAIVGKVNESDNKKFKTQKECEEKLNEVKLRYNNAISALVNANEQFDDEASGI